MIGYRLTVNCDTKGYLTWSLLFDSPDAKYGDTNTDSIFSVAREFVNALNRINKQGKVPSDKIPLKTVRDTLAECRYQLSTLDGLIAADGEAPDETFPIDNAEIIQKLSEADGILDALERNRNPDCS